MTQVHPAGWNTTDRRLWFGKEIEGELAHQERPPHTAFVQGILSPEEFGMLLGRVMSRKVTHIFLTELFTELTWFEAVILPMLQACPAPLITFGRWPEQVAEIAAKPWFDKVSLIVRANLQAPWLKLLRANDQVSVGVPYDLVTWSVRSGIATVPDQYEDDE